jgi:hypothetical protein
MICRALHLSRRHRYAAYADLSSDKERLGSIQGQDEIELDGAQFGCYVAAGGQGCGDEAADGSD